MNIDLKQLLILQNLQHSEVADFLWAAFPQRGISVGYNTISQKWSIQEQGKADLNFVNSDTIHSVTRAVATSKTVL